MTRALRLRPLIREARLAVLEFLLSTIKPQAPHLGELLAERAILLDERKAS